MRVLLINSVIGYGSTGTITLDLYNKIVSNDDCAIVAYGRKKSVNGIVSNRLGNKFSTMHHILITRLFDKHGYGSKLATKKLVSFIEEFKPDIIHIHNIHGYYLNIEILFNFLSNKEIPIIWSLHDCWAFTGHCAHFEKAKCDKWKTNCEKCPLKKEYPHSFLLDNSYNNYKLKKELFCSLNNLTLICPSMWLCDKVKSSFLKSAAIKTINNGIDLSTFKPTKSDIKEKYKISDKKIVLGVASIFTKQKGFDDFLSLSRFLPQKYVIIMIGVSKKQISSLPSNIIGVQRLNSKLEVAMFYSAADVFFNPTKEDTYPTTIMESIACATPVVTYDVGGCKELVNENTGIVTEFNDVNYAKDAIISLMKKPLDEENMLKSSQAFDKNRYINNIYDEYVSVCKK